MKKTRLSLYYLATYLFLTGVALMAAPIETIKLLFSTGNYDDVFIRFLGSFMVALSILVTQMIRHKLEVLYPTTLFIRSFFIVTIVWLYSRTSDPLFLAILGVVSLGVVLTLLGFISDKALKKK